MCPPGLCLCLGRLGELWRRTSPVRAGAGPAVRAPARKVAESRRIRVRSVAGSHRLRALIPW
ncbi:protein of unknown function [Streptomyces murinus]